MKLFFFGPREFESGRRDNRHAVWSQLRVLFIRHSAAGLPCVELHDAGDDLVIALGRDGQLHALPLRVVHGFQNANHVAVRVHVGRAAALVGRNQVDGDFGNCAEGLDRLRDRVGELGLLRAGNAALRLGFAEGLECAFRVFFLLVVRARTHVNLQVVV